MTIEQIIYDYIKTHPGTSFVEIEKVFEKNGIDWKGHKCLFSSEREKMIVLWGGWSEEAVEIMLRVFALPGIEGRLCDPLIYLVDGKALKYPITKSAERACKSPHWFPAIFSFVSEVKI